ncbi:MAG: globin family protein, partial [Cyanobacteria bacterium J06641_5]
LFTAYPEAQPLFETTDMNAQKKKLVGSLVLVVENLRSPDALTTALKGLGARHVQYGALPEHYPLVGNALLMTFEQYLGGDWTAETKQAWVDAYGAITTLMLEGADYNTEDLDLESAPPAAAVDETAAAESGGGLQVELLESSFEKVKPKAAAFASSFYDNLFAAYPAAKPLFNTTDLAAQQKKLVASLVLVVENLRKPDVLGSTLKGLGARHVQYGALPEHYPLVGNALLMTFEQYLGSDWTAATKQAWVDAYGAISTLMLEGADYSTAEIALESAAPATAEVVPSEAGKINWVAFGGAFGGLGVLALLMLLL